MAVSSYLLMMTTAPCSGETAAASANTSSNASTCSGVCWHDELHARRGRLKRAPQHWLVSRPRRGGDYGIHYALLRAMTASAVMIAHNVSLVKSFWGKGVCKQSLRSIGL